MNRLDSLIAVEVSGTTDFQAGARRALFSTTPYVIPPFHRSYEVAPDDRSFLMPQRTGATGAEANRLTVVLNWFGEARAKMKAH